MDSAKVEASDIRIVARGGKVTLDGTEVCPPGILFAPKSKDFMLVLSIYLIKG